jgi:hypothetical protein
MACCKCCCGKKECDEGEEGKCCCGNECCAAGTYCCNAECVDACSEGQEGDCKCTDACCAAGEYCCDDACVSACEEGGQGPCKCGSDCCPDGNYCCDGVCQEEPCEQACETDDDCPMYALVNAGLGGCPGATFDYYVYATAEEAIAAWEDVAGDCESPINVVEFQAICCDGLCYPAAGDLPFGFNGNPGDVTCP